MLSSAGTLLGGSIDGKSSATKLDNIGFAFPFPTSQGSFVVAFGYNRVADYTTSLGFNGFNPNSSIVPSLYDNDANFDIPFQIYLENKDGYTPITGNVNQSGTVKETGSLGNWAFAASMDIAPDFSFGVTLNVLNGSYQYSRNYLEEDTRNVYKNVQANLTADSAYLRFNKFYLDNTIDETITGVNALFGFMYRSDRFRVGLTMKTPTTVKVSETYTDRGQSVFDGNYSPGQQIYSTTADNSFSVVSPWDFGFGISVEPVIGLILAGDVEYADWAQIEWADNQDLQNNPNFGNTKLPTIYRSVANLRFGAEYEIQNTGIRVRGGYMITPSPYQGDPSSYDVKTATAGAGILLQNNVLLDLGLAFGSFDTFHSNYVDQNLRFASRTDESVKTTRVNFTISYRF
jgi:long-subunit fatty acid transport protein